jgi:hypothetical protein
MRPPGSLCFHLMQSHLSIIVLITWAIGICWQNNCLSLYLPVFSLSRPTVVSGMEESLKCRVPAHKSWTLSLTSSTKKKKKKAPELVSTFWNLHLDLQSSLIPLWIHLFSSVGIKGIASLLYCSQLILW